MELFNNDIINISNILSVNKYIATAETLKKRNFIKYNTKLKAYELVFFVSGGSNTHFCGVDMKDAPNSMRYLPKGNFNGEYIVKNIEPGCCIDIYFDTQDIMPEFAIGFENMDIVRDKFLKIYNIWTDRKPDYYINAMMVFYDIIRTIKNFQHKYTDRKQQEGLKKAYEYIFQNYKSHNFNYDELCKSSGFASSYFHELFATIYHMSPVKFVTKMKIDYAKELLITNRYSITEIADMCGFDNIYYFSTVFKKHTGVCPSEYPNKMLTVL